MYSSEIQKVPAYQYMQHEKISLLQYLSVSRTISFSPSSTYHSWVKSSLFKTQLNYANFDVKPN